MAHKHRQWPSSFHGQDLWLYLLLIRLSKNKHKQINNWQMTSAILKLDLDIDRQVVCLQEATHKLYAHDALITEENTHWPH